MSASAEGNHKQDNAPTVLRSTSSAVEPRCVSGFQQPWPWPGHPGTSLLCLGQEDGTRGGTRMAPITAPPRGPSARGAAGCVAVTIPTNVSSKLVFRLPSFTPPGASPPLFGGPPGHSLIKQLLLKQAERHFKLPPLTEAEEPLHLPSTAAEGRNSHLPGHPQPKPAWRLPDTWPHWQEAFLIPFSLRLMMAAVASHYGSPPGGGLGTETATLTLREKGHCYRAEPGVILSYPTTSLWNVTELQYFRTSVLV